jgi:predicted dehydrogenase
MTDRRNLRIGFVGVGKMGQCAHLRNYAALPDCEVVALAELRPELGKKVAARYGVPRVYNDHKKMLAEEELDGIVASHHFRRHGLLLPELLEAGLPLFTEKPLAGSVEAGQVVLDALAKSGTWHMVGYHKRADPATMHAKAEIDRLKETGELGTMRYVRILMPRGRDWTAGGFDEMIKTGEPFPKVAMEPPASDMDAETFKTFTEFTNYYIHHINLMRHLLGEPYHVAYCSPHDVVLAVESQSGVPGVIEMEPYCTTLDWREEALVAFERGYVKISLPAPLAYNRPGRVKILRDPGDGATPQTIAPTLPWVHAMRRQAALFLQAIRGECKPPCEAAEAMADLKNAREYIQMRYGK